MRARGFALVFVAVLLGDANRGLVLPTLFSFLQQLGGGAKALGIANSGFSLGRLLVAPAYGVWVDRRPCAEVLLVTSLLAAAANAAYTAATSLRVAVAARCVLGVGASTLARPQPQARAHPPAASRRVTQRASPSPAARVTRRACVART